MCRPLAVGIGPAFVSGAVLLVAAVAVVPSSPCPPRIGPDAAGFDQDFPCGLLAFAFLAKAGTVVLHGVVRFVHGEWLFGLFVWPVGGPRGDDFCHGDLVASYAISDGCQPFGNG